MHQILRRLQTPTGSRDTLYYNPSDIHTFPKAEPRNWVFKGRKRYGAAILADTPNKNELEAEQAKRNANKKVKFGGMEKI